MTAFLARRLLQWLPVLVISSIVVFSIIHLLPGDPAFAIAGPDAPAEVVDAVRRNLGLDRSLPQQYVTWITRALRGDFGDSFIYHSSAANLILERLPNSLEVAAAGLVLAVLFAIPVGVLAAVRVGRLSDWLTSMGTSLMLATPGFWFGILLLIVVSLKWHLLPPGGRVGFGEDPAAAVRSLILPAVALSFNSAATLARFTRIAMLEVLDEPYVRTARAKGAGAGRVIIKHALRNALIPVVTMMGIVFGHMIGGAIVIESVFAWPGVGRLLVTSVSNRDYSVVQGILLLLVLLFLLINLLVDLLYGLLDPRIRLAVGRARR